MAKFERVSFSSIVMFARSTIVLDFPTAEIALLLFAHCPDLGNSITSAHVNLFSVERVTSFRLGHVGDVLPEDAVRTLQRTR